MGWFGGRQISDTAAANSAVAVVSNTPFVLGACRGLLVGTAGTADVTFADGTIYVGFPLQAGYNPLSVKSINLNGTAAGVIALY